MAGGCLSTPQVEGVNVARHRSLIPVRLDCRGRFLTLGVALTLVSTACGGTTTVPRRVSAVESSQTRRVSQSEPTVSFFGSPTNPFWVVCHNDSTNRGTGGPDASGITCEASPGAGGPFSDPIVIRGQAPFAAGDPLPSTDPWLAKDPANPSVVWLVGLMTWDSATAGRRRSVGVAKLVRDPDTGNVTVHEPSPGLLGDSGRMVPVAANDVEGPVDATKGPTPDRPTIAIDPSPDQNGRHAQYIAFFQNDNSTQPNRGRLLVMRRDSPAARFWSSPVVVRAAGVAVDSSGFTGDQDRFQFQAPQLFVRPATHAVGIAFIRLQLQGEIDPDTPVNISNADSIGNQISYFFGVSPDGARSPWEAREAVRTRAGAVDTGFSGTDSTRATRFSAVPYPTLAFDESTTRWVLAVLGSGTTRTPVHTGKWELEAVTSEDDGLNWSQPVTVSQSALFAGDNPRNNIFPAMCFDPQARRVALGYMESVDVGDRGWQPLVSYSNTAGRSWTSADRLMDPPTELRGARPEEYSWEGHWAGSTRPGYVGDYTSIACAGGRVFFAWTDFRERNNDPPPMDVFGAETARG
jgi:hypothetical protein